MANHLKLYSGLSVYFGSDLKTKAHAHHALEIVFALDGLLTIHGIKTIKSEGVIIKPDTVHSISGKGLIISILLDSDTALCSELVSMLGSKHIVKLEPSVTRTLITYFHNHDSHLTESAICEMLSNSLASGNNLDAHATHQLDRRIVDVIDLIKSSPTKSIAFKTMLKVSALSESRLMHLFKKETGVTIRKFILWTKLQHAIKLHQVGNSLKRSASLSGFTDAAHFNRVFVSNYGLNPSSMLK